MDVVEFCRAVLHEVRDWISHRRWNSWRNDVAYEPGEPTVPDRLKPGETKNYDVTLYPPLDDQGLLMPGFDEGSSIQTSISYNIAVSRGSSPGLTTYDRTSSNNVSFTAGPLSDTFGGEIIVGTVPGSRFGRDPRTVREGSSW